jgi:hypothetical protein
VVAQLKFSGLDRATTVGANDILYVVKDPDGVPTSVMVKQSDLFSSFVVPTLPKANSSVAGIAGAGTLLVANSSGFLSVNSTYIDNGDVNAYASAVGAAATTAAALAGNAYSNAVTVATNLFNTVPTIVYVDGTLSYSAETTDRYILVDANAVTHNVTIILAADDPNSTLHTIKNVEPGSRTVYIDGSSANTIEDPTTHDFLTEVTMGGKGTSLTYLMYNGKYRLIS